MCHIHILPRTSLLLQRIHRSRPQLLVYRSIRVQKPGLLRTRVAHRPPLAPRSCFVATAKAIVARYQRAELRRRLACCFPAALLAAGPAAFAGLADRAYWCRKYARANAVSNAASQANARTPGAWLPRQRGTPPRGRKPARARLECVHLAMLWCFAVGGPPGQQLTAVHPGQQLL